MNKICINTSKHENALAIPLEKTIKKYCWQIGNKMEIDA